MDNDKVKLVDMISRPEALGYVSDNLYRILLDESSDPIFAFSSSGRYIYVNNVFANTMRVKPSDIIGKKIWDVFPGEEGDKRFAAVKEVFATGEMKNIEVRVPTPNGDLYFLTTVKPMKDDKGVVVFVICISKNVTEMKKVKEELEKAKNEAETANRAKSEFISNMSHEIRTPLNAVIGFSELLKRSIKDKKSAEYIKGITAGGKSLLSIINDILDLSKIEAGKITMQYEPTNIYSVLNDVKQIFSFQVLNKNINFILNIASDVPKFILIDEIRIRQILLNIVGNAIKFTHSGYVRINVRAELIDKVLEKFDIVFEVEDTGIGIPKEQWQTIFEAFRQQSGQSTRKYGGTGLGLTITKKLVEMMNGEISLSSEVDKGSIFKIIIKNTKIELNSKEMESEIKSDEKIVFKNAKILYAEDVECNIAVLKGFLEDYNFDIVEAYDGIEALERAKKIIPDIILTDVHMPLMDGFELIKNIRGNEVIKSIPVVALTASTLNEEALEIKKYFNDYLEKPIDREKLINILKKYLQYEKLENETSTVIDKRIEFIEEKIYISEEDRKQIEESLKKVESGMVIQEIAEFSIKLTEIGKKYGSKNYIIIADELNSAMNSYDADIIEAVLNRLKKVLLGEEIK